MARSLAEITSERLNREAIAAKELALKAAHKAKDAVFRHRAVVLAHRLLEPGGEATIEHLRAGQMPIRLGDHPLGMELMAQGLLEMVTIRTRMFWFASELGTAALELIDAARKPEEV
jgi:hypothetical protein